MFIITILQAKESIFVRTKRQKNVKDFTKENNHSLNQLSDKISLLFSMHVHMVHKSILCVLQKRMSKGYSLSLDDTLHENK